jgi:hypothetical protein
VVAAAGVDVAGFTDTHFSFLPAPLSDSSSSDVTLSSVSASTPVVFSDSEESLDELSVVSADVFVDAASTVASVEVVDVSVLDDAVASRIAFFALRASLRSSFCDEIP